MVKSGLGREQLFIVAAMLHQLITVLSHIVACLFYQSSYELHLDCSSYEYNMAGIEAIGWNCISIQQIHLK